jgi:asparagine synthase (glutamine-hydrolysing)
MCGLIEHRGPDARGTFLRDGVGLGVQRLRIIDLATGDQPIFNEDRSAVVVLNGEIYNYRELRRELIASGHTFSTGTDTEVIVHLYEEHGVACVSRLHGMFAFALWDVKAQRLLLARDRVGKKPLYYSLGAGTITFGSELNAVMADPGVSRDIDHRAIDCYLALQYVPAPMSAFRAVSKLPPASTLVWHAGAVEVARYWRLDFSKKQERRPDAEVYEEIRDHITRAVRRRMIADVPLGAFLSGGVDSSAVVAAMAAASPHPVRTFSIGFDSERFNELEHARKVARRFGTDHQEFVVRPDALEMLPKIVRHHGEPFADSSAIPSFYLAELASRHVTVALNGDGGDESFAGYPRYPHTAALARLERIPGPIRRAGALLGGLVPSSSRKESGRNRVRRLAQTLDVDTPTRYFSYLSSLGGGLDLDALYTPDFRELVGESVAEEVVTRPWRHSTAGSLIDVMLDVDIQTYLPGDLLTKMDIATMAFSLEARSPLLDHEFLEMAASLPPEMKVRGGEKKVALRAALRPWLPDDILDRPKRGFEVPVSEWLRGDLRTYVREVLLDGTARRRDWFQADYIRRLEQRHAAGADDNSKGLWTLLMLELWHREFVDHPPAASPSGVPPVAGRTAGG